MIVKGVISLGSGRASNGIVKATMTYIKNKNKNCDAINNALKGEYQASRFIGILSANLRPSEQSGPNPLPEVHSACS